MRERLETTTSYTNTESLNRTADRTRYYDENFREISRTDYNSGVKGFIIPELDIDGMREKLYNPTIIQEYPKVKRLFQQSRLFNEYITSGNLQNSFIQRVFLGLLASESSFGTITTVRSENTNKGLYQITGESFRDAPNAKYYKTLWPFNERPQRKHITDLEYAARLCVLNFDRIYEITRPLLSNFSESDKSELILPIFIIAYNQGAGAAKRILRQVIEYKRVNNRFPSRTQMLQNAFSSNLYRRGHLSYFFKIWYYSNNLRSEEQQVSLQASRLSESTEKREQVTQQSRQARRELSAEVTETNLTTQRPTTETTSQSAETPLPDLDPSINFPDDLSNLEYRTVAIPRDLQLPQRPYLDTSIEQDPEIFANEFIDDQNPKTFGDFYFDNQNRTIDDLTQTELALSIIQKYSPRFSASQTRERRTESYTFPFGIEVKRITTSADTSITLLKFNQNLRELFSSTHINYYNTWPINPSYSVNTEQETETENNPQQQRQEVSAGTQERQPLDTTTQRATRETQTQELTWADIFDESNSLNKFSDRDIQYFIIDTFMPERQTQTQADGIIVHTDTYPFDIVVKTRINSNSKLQSLPAPREDLRTLLLQTPLSRFERKDRNIDPSFRID